MSTAAADTQGPARKFVEAQYNAKSMMPFIEQRVEAQIATPAKVEKVVAAIRSQLPEFYSEAANAVAPLMAGDQLSKVAEFAASATGRKMALADLRWAEEVRDQAEVCLEDGAGRIASVATDRARAVALAARLVLGDCTVMREAKKELTGSIPQAHLTRARVYVSAGGVREETIRALAHPAAEAAAKALVAAKVAPKSQARALSGAVLDAVAKDAAHWKEAAALHYAAAFQSDDLKRLAAFVTSDAGAQFLAAKPKIDVAVSQTAESWFTASIDAALQASSAAATRAASAAAAPVVGPLPDLKPQLVLKPRSQPEIVMKPE
jgi:hypothetical protein